MPDNPHPLWRRERCEHCKAGRSRNNNGVHVWQLGPHADVQASASCTAPIESAYIAELESKIAELEKDRARLDRIEAEEVEVSHPTRGFGWWVGANDSGVGWGAVMPSLRLAIDDYFRLKDAAMVAQDAGKEQK